MPLIHSKSPKAFKTNVSNLLHEWKHGDSPHVKSQKQALAIAYSIKRRGKQAGGAVSPYADPPPYIARPNEYPPPPSQYNIPTPQPRPQPMPRPLPHTRRAESGGLIEHALRAAHNVAQQLQGGGGALPLAKAPGTMVAPPFAGPLKGEGPGRHDRVRLDVKPGSYVFPADTVSIMGEGNSAAGQLAIKQMFGGLNLTGGIQMQPGRRGRYGPMSITPPGMPKPPHAQMKKPKQQRHAEGGEASLPYHDSPPTQPTGDEGEDENVPIIAADGEVIVPPELIHAKFGDLDKGHQILDKFVLLQRAEEIKRLKSAPPPKK